MKIIQTNSGLNVKTGVKAGGRSVRNHNRSGLRVKVSVKAGGFVRNHNRALCR